MEVIAPALVWALIARAQSRSSRVCLFDRPGLGLSVPRPEGAPPNGPVANANEMTALLEALGEAGPFVLVGWSYGGLLARTAGALAPERVAGLVLVDSAQPGQWKVSGPGVWTEAGSSLDMQPADDVLESAPTLGSKPVAVLAAGRREEGMPSQLWEWWRSAQSQGAASISQNVAYWVVEKADHAIPIRAPEAVLASTAAVLDAVRDGAAIDRCPATLATAGITC